MSTPPAVYRHPDAMEPLLPQAGRERMAEWCQQITLKVGQLTGAVHSPVVRQEIAGVVRNMNCYYSNLIEGHKTLPRDIETALRNEPGPAGSSRDNRLLAAAHVRVEDLMDRRLVAEPELDVWSPDFVRWIHGEFYRQLPDSLRVARTRSGREYAIEPGEWRTFMVDVGGHTPPDAAAVPVFLQRFHSFYAQDKILATNRLVAIAAAHHRLAWIHPFGDGNGRVVRLHSHALLQRYGLAAGSMWTLSRGLARRRQAYMDGLSDADRQRENDYDGRGNLSDRALSRFCLFFLEVLADQVEFMAGLLDLGTLRRRVERHFQFEALHLVQHREEITRLVLALVDEGEIPREKVPSLIGKASTVSSSVIRTTLAEGYATTPSPRGVLRVAFPAKLLETFFPKLFLDAPEADA